MPRGFPWDKEGTPFCCLSLKGNPYPKKEKKGTTGHSTVPTRRKSPGRVQMPCRLKHRVDQYFAAQHFKRQAKPAHLLEKHIFSTPISWLALEGEQKRNSSSVGISTTKPQVQQKCKMLPSNHRDLETNSKSPTPSQLPHQSFSRLRALGRRRARA